MNTFEKYNLEKNIYVKATIYRILFLIYLEKERINKINTFGNLLESNTDIKQKYVDETIQRISLTFFNHKESIKTNCVTHRNRNNRIKNKMHNKNFV